MIEDQRPSARPPRPRPKQKKRKRPVDEGQQQRPRSNGTPATGVNASFAAGGDDGSSNNNTEPHAKKQKRKEKKPKSRRKTDNDDNDPDADLDLDLGLNRAIAAMDRYLLADYLARQTQRFGSAAPHRLSSIELADLTVPARAIRDTAAYDRDRTLENLPDFLATFADDPSEAGADSDKNKEKTHKQLSSAPAAPNGSPHTIVVTGAGLRAADLVRALRPFQSKTNAIAKLFAKHIKLAEAVAFLGAHRTGIAVGTPARLLDLLDNGALRVDHLRRLVVDASHIDQKKRGVLDMPDTALPVARWLARPEFKARYDAGDGSGGVDGEAAGPPLSVLFY
ncbi:DNA/RNA helicase, DEAD/DEAH box type [Niveomyces insectorum RCEF 264]|uniref:DNA/RNA helicase, DEAD/DEAH box type n=1 Tax=Niveomyces insectorum RCEF 264 TaxID=1081102 RepID=A0A167TG32_9HYPO|nr:DNA/RNA helicase, DEAD/DEAH box type [Niveomyces insectorum RCEF 264]